METRFSFIYTAKYFFVSLEGAEENNENHQATLKTVLIYIQDVHRVQCTLSNSISLLIGIMKWADLKRT